MRWYNRSTRTASRPPSYVQERLSDLSRITKISFTAPGDARDLLLRVVAQMKAQKDDEYVSPLEEAARKAVDSPPTLRSLVESVMMSMRMDAEE